MDSSDGYEVLALRSLLLNLHFRSATIPEAEMGKCGDMIHIPRAIFAIMARLARVVVPGLPHHVTQRGNRRPGCCGSIATPKLGLQQLLLDPDPGLNPLEIDSPFQ